jgi:hypothetical protein
VRRLGALALALACEAEGGRADCHGVCGPGTRCAGGLCVVADAPAGANEPAPSTEEPRRRGRGRRRGAVDGAADEPAADPVDAPPIDDDASVPAYDRTATQVLDMKGGSERLADATVQTEMREVEPQLDRCIAAAVARGASVPPGKIELAFAVEPTGAVAGVDVRASAAVREAGVVPCLRKALAAHRFPAWDGPRADVEYAFEVQ